MAANKDLPVGQAALRLTIRLAQDQPLLVVLDEAPRLLAGRSDLPDLVSALWENRVRDQHVMLVLTGSAVGIMEELLGRTGGLHRRANLELRLDPFTLSEARPFLPDVAPVTYLQAYAACGGYPLHLQRWRPTMGVDANLRAMAFTPGGLLLADAMEILSEDLDWRGGYERVLGAVGGGIRRRSRIAGRAQQRIDYTLDRLRRAGYVRAVRPIGAAPTAGPIYEIADDYLAFFFAVLRDDADLIDGGQGDAVRARVEGRWQTHLGRVFEAECRRHAQRLVARGELPAEMIVGRWWRDEVVEADVVGLIGANVRLLGECRWQQATLRARDVAALRRKLTALPEAHPDLELALWSRGGIEPAVRLHNDVRHYTVADVVDG